MLEWLNQATDHTGAVPLWVLQTRLLIAFCLGCLTAGIYHFTAGLERNGSSRPFLATLVLLTVVIALVTVVIGDSVARAFSLVGALAIVRFRTVVEDTRDTAFVIFAVVVGMASGTGQVIGTIVGMPLVLLASWMFSGRRAVTTEGNTGTLHVRLGTGITPPELEPVLQQHVKGHRLTAVSTARGGAALDVTYSLTHCSPDIILRLVALLNQMEGVQSVEIRER